MDNNLVALSSQIGKLVGELEEGGEEVVEAVKVTPYERADPNFPKPDGLVLCKPSSKKDPPWWDPFHLVSGNDAIAYCNYCGKNVKCNGASTSGLISHMKVHHKPVHSFIQASIKATESLDKLTQRSLTGMGFVPIKETDESKEQRLLEKVCRFIVINMKPISIVTNEDFRDIMRELGRCYYSDPERNQYSQPTTSLTG